MIYLPKAVSALAQLAARQSARYSMQGIRMRDLAGGFRLDVTDGRAVAIVHGGCEPSEQDLEAADRISQTETLALEAVVPLETLVDCLKGLGKTQRGVQRLAIQLQKDQAAMSYGDHVAYTQLVEGRFPDVDGILPKGPAPVRVYLNPDLLIKVLKAASEISKGGPKNAVIELLYWKPGAPIGIATVGPDGLVFDALVMPCF